MKIAILTILDNWGNYGAVLQMLALKNYLTMLGHEVCFVRPPERLEMIRYDISNYIRNYSIDKKKKLYILRIINKYIRILYYALKTFISQIYYRCRYRRIFRRIDLKNIKNVDLVIMGSDTLWDLENRIFQDSFYWGDEILDQGVQIITYAVSCDSLEKLDVKKYPWILKCIPKIRSISVRDYHTKNLVKKYSDKDIAVVCDPTLLCPNTLELKKINIKKRYILIYAFELNDIEVECIKWFAKKEDLLIVCAMGFTKFDFADRNIDCGFEGFSRVVRGAAYIYTSTFHGCMFAIIHNKKALFRAKNNKIIDLINRFELMDRVFDDSMSPIQFSYRIKADLNIEKVESIKKSFVRESKKYLQNVLDEMQEEIHGHD